MKRFAILGNHLPRHCGIATFTTHLADGWRWGSISQLLDWLDRHGTPCSHALTS